MKKLILASALFCFALAVNAAETTKTAAMPMATTMAEGQAMSKDKKCDCKKCKDMGMKCDKKTCDCKAKKDKKNKKNMKDCKCKEGAKDCKCGMMKDGKMMSKEGCKCGKDCKCAMMKDAKPCACTEGQKDCKCGKDKMMTEKAAK